MGKKLHVLARWVKDYIFWILIMAGVVTLFVIERPSLLKEKHPHIQFFFTELAFASIIASTIGLTLDRYQREEFSKLVNREREELKKDIFLYAYGHAVPEQIREEIKERILNCPFQREDLRIEWEFSHVPDRPDQVTVEKRHTYVLRNNTAQSQMFKFELNQITAAENEVLIAHEFQSLKVRRKTSVEISLGPNDVTDLRPRDEPHVRQVSKEFVIEPLEDVEIFFAIKETRRAYADDFYAASHPVVGTTLVTIRVNPPLVLEVSAACKGKSLKTRPEHDALRRYSWQVNEGLLPYQGVAFSWSPRQGALPFLENAAPIQQELPDQQQN